jgi:hypothetical protein
LQALLCKSLLFVGAEKLAKPWLFPRLRTHNFHRNSGLSPSRELLNGSCPSPKSSVFYRASFRKSLAKASPLFHRRRLRNAPEGLYFSACQSIADDVIHPPSLVPLKLPSRLWEISTYLFKCSFTYWLHPSTPDFLRFPPFANPFLWGLTPVTAVEWPYLYQPIIVLVPQELFDIFIFKFLRNSVHC